jgi:hypothetical protein
MGCYPPAILTDSPKQPVVVGVESQGTGEVIRGPQWQSTEEFPDIALAFGQTRFFQSARIDLLIRRSTYSDAQTRSAYFPAHTSIFADERDQHFGILDHNLFGFARARWGIFGRLRGVFQWFVHVSVFSFAAVYAIRTVPHLEFRNNAKRALYTRSLQS